MAAEPHDGCLDRACECVQGRLREIARLLDRSTQTGKAPTADEWKALEIANAAFDDTRAHEDTTGDKR